MAPQLGLAEIHIRIYLLDIWDDFGRTSYLWIFGWERWVFGGYLGECGALRENKTLADKKKPPRGA